MAVNQTPLPVPHPAPGKAGVLLVNLGTPDAPEQGAIRRYLKQFLGDPRVVEIPRPIWWLILNLIILPLRPRGLVDKYKQIWLKGGSPIKVITEQQSFSLSQRLQARAGDQVEVRHAMTYGNPSIASAVDAFIQNGVERILVMPLYPQYSSTTTAAVWDSLHRSLATRRDIPEIRFLKRYHLHPRYIEALVESIRSHWRHTGRQGFLLFSFHGIPKANIDKGDPYQRECQETAQAVATTLGLAPEQWKITYQSRVGRAEWLTPYTDETMKELGKQGLTGLDVICPGFAADCLETLEEIKEENKEYFEHAGGKDFHYIEALNAQASHIDLLEELALTHLQGWIKEAVRAESSLGHKPA